MSRQDKATTEKFARTLRELVKRPENKVCADCKRNDPRWASWNLGVFLCIRCSGIHRSMGTHISKVKSVDLDVWTPEQMESITKWGNHFANLYWEAHLKAGHVPPDHKMESFIRSKYESRRWALEGPIPSDPSVLDGGVTRVVPPAATTPPPQAVSSRQQTSSSAGRPSHGASGSISRGQPAPPITTRQPQGHHQLLSSNFATRPTGVVPAPAVPQPQAAPVAPKPVENDLFSLDFHAPPSTTAQAPVPEQKKDVKQDILSLFSAAPTTAPVAAFGQYGNTSALWGGQVMNNQVPQQQVPMQTTSMVGSNGTGMWGVSSGWTGQPSGGISVQNNVWGASSPAVQQVQQPSVFDTNSIWGGAAVPPAGGPDLFGSMAAPSAPPAKKNDDAFGDIWGGFK